MIREIKFRAYYETEKRMMPWHELCCDEDENLQTYFSNSLSDVSPLMQYTGLKDKNGKEIYEGDIIKSNDHNPSLFEVKFIEGGFCGVYSKKEANEYPIDINHFYDSTGCCIEVIGNVYQNHELLVANND